MKESATHPPLKDLVQIRAGYQTRKSVKEVPSGSHALLQIRDFNDERTEINVRKVARIAPGSISEDQVLREGDVVFLSKGAKNFAFAPAELPRPALAASYFFILRPGDALAPEYLAWYLNLESTKNLLRKYATQGAHMPVVRKDVLEALEVPVPDLVTQRKIVALAELAARQEELLTELAERKKALATAACLRAADQSSTRRNR